MTDEQERIGQAVEAALKAVPDGDAAEVARWLLAHRYEEFQLLVLEAVRAEIGLRRASQTPGPSGGARVDPDCPESLEKAAEPEVLPLPVSPGISCLSEPPEGVTRMWQGSTFMLDARSGELYEFTADRDRKVPGVWQWEFQDLRVREISLVPKGACRYAVIALVK
jgi:hypothetical protein